MVLYHQIMLKYDIFVKKVSSFCLLNTAFEGNFCFSLLFFLKNKKSAHVTFYTKKNVHQKELYYNNVTTNYFTVIKHIPITIFIFTSSNLHKK